MSLETDYIEYGVEVSLSILGLSAAYFIDPSSPITFLSLLLVPILYGYTAYISHDGFNHASLVSLSALVFTVVGGLTAVVAVLYGVGNVLVSLFSHGMRFKEFYSATSIPLLAVGILIGSSMFAYGTLNPEFQNNVIESVGEEAGEISGSLPAVSAMVENQKTKQIELVNTTTVTAVRLTSQEVMNDTGASPKLSKAFQQAEQPVKERIYSQYREGMENRSTSLSKRIEDSITRQLKTLSFVIVIPIVAAFFYSLQPLLGLLTAICAKSFKLIDGQIST
jgi:hypothetical protein